MMLIVSPRAESTRIDVRIESGIETAMITVLRQLPRKIKIMMPVKQAAMMASRTTPSEELLLREAAPRKGELQDRNARGAVGDDEGRRGPRRHGADRRL